MATTDQLLSAMHALAHRYGLPDGLDYSADWKLLCFCDEGGSSPYWIDPEESQLFPCWLAAALAHWEALAAEGLGLSIDNPYCMQAFCWSDGASCGDTVYFTPGDLLSRLTARTLALLDGVRTVAVEGEK